MVREPTTALLILLSLSLPLSAQSLDQAAARARQRRKACVAGPSKVFTSDDLRKYAVEGPPEAAAEPTTDQPWAASNGVSQAAHRRHWASAEAYLKECASRLTSAKERWLAVSDTKPPRAVEQARRAVMTSGRALERAQLYRDEAEVAARRAGVEAGGR
jgi:hypothetical protein